MKKLILVLSLILISICLLTSCNNQENDIDTDIKTGYIENIEDITVNFKCKVEMGEGNFYIYGEKAKNLYELAFSEFNAGERVNGITSGMIDGSIIRLAFMSDVVDEEKDYLTWKDDSEDQYWHGELIFYRDDTSFFSPYPLVSYAETRQLDKGDFLLIQNYINLIK